MDLNDSQLMYGSTIVLLLFNIALFISKKYYGITSFLIQLAYSAYFCWGLNYDSGFGAGLAWWFYFLIVNCLHIIALLLYFVFKRLKKPQKSW